MPRHLISVLVLAVFVVVAPPAAASSRDAARFAAFAKRAHASGTLELSVRFRGDPDRCTAANTCGATGTVSAPLRLDPRRALRVRGAVVVLPVTGTAAADVRDTVAGRRCAATASVRTAGLGFTGDARGLLLRPRGSPTADPFDTNCRSPQLDDLGGAALASARLRTVSSHVKVVRIRLHARRVVHAHGYIATVTTDARLVLRR